MALSVVYFAWVRERIGRGGEAVEPPPHVGTVGALLDWLSDRDADARAAFADRHRLRAAVDGRFVPLEASIESAGEVAIFPPVTGG